MKIIPWKLRRDSKPSLFVGDMDREIENFFKGLFEPNHFLTQVSDWSPRLDLSEDKDEIVVTADLPGMKKDDINVSLDDGVLTISGHRAAEKKKEDGGWYHSERYSGSFSRSITLPSGIDPSRINGDYKDGVLTVTVAKKEGPKPTRINIG